MSDNNGSSGVGISTQGLSSCQEIFKAEAASLAAVPAVAGKTTESFAVAYNTNNSQGVENTNITYLDQVGTPVPAPTPSYFSIGGQGVTVNRDSSGNVGFCRNGTYAPDSKGNFVNNVGQFLQVALTNPNGSLINPLSTATNLTTLNTNNIVQGAQATKNMSIQALLNGLAAVGDTSTITGLAKDSFGTDHALTGTWTKIGTTAGGVAPQISGATQAWTLTFNDLTDVGIVGAPYANSGTSPGIVVEFDANGAISGYYPNGTAPTSPPATSPPAIDITWSNGAQNSSINLNLGAIGSTNGVNVAGNIYETNNIITDGYSAGNFSSINFSEAGEGIVTLTNGQQITYCIIPFARFNNVNGLQESSPGVFQQTADSGAYNLFSPGQGGTGNLVPGTYEGSTVDGTKIYLKMLSTQQAFLGNVNAIKVGNEMNDQLMSI